MQVFDKNLKRVGTLIDAYQIERRRKLNSDNELSFLVPMSSDDYTEKLQLKGHVKDDRGQYYVINTRNRQRDKNKLTALITCTHIMFKMGDYKVPYDEYIEEAYGVHISTLLDKISAWTGGRFKFVVHDTFDLWDIKDFGHTNALAALTQVINTFKAEIRADNFTIHIHKKTGTNDRYEFRTKKNIIRDSFKDDTTNLVTRMYAYMKDGVTFRGISTDHLTADELSLLQSVPGVIVNGKLAVNYLLSPYVNHWGSESVPFYDGENVQQDLTDPVELLKSTREELKKTEMPQLEITVEAADLHKIDADERPPDLGDAATVYDPNMDMHRIAVRVVELTEYPYSKDQHTKVTLSNFALKDDIDLIADLEKNRRVMTNLLSGGRIRADAFEAFAKQAVVDINNSKTEIKYDARGILLQSKVNENDQVIMTSNGIILTTDGGKTARTAVNAKGVSAEVIAGQLGSFVSLFIGKDNNVTQINTKGIAAGHANFNSAPFQVDMKGNLLANKLTANYAQIKSSSFSEGAIVGSSINVGNGRFVVNTNGSVFAADGTFTGTINAKSGTFEGPIYSRGEIIGGTITGAILRTAVSGRRIEVNESGLRTFDSNNQNRIRMNTGSDSGISAISFFSSRGAFAGEINSYDSQEGLNIISNDITIGSSNTGNPIVLSGAVEFLGNVNFNYGVSGLNLKIQDISGLKAELDTIRWQLWNHTHKVTIPNHNHGKTEIPNSGGGTFTTSTP
jgi:phage minor structural protein